MLFTVLQSVAFFSAVDIDHVLRKETNMSCLTPSNKEEISEGMSLTITELIEEMRKANVNMEEFLGSGKVSDDRTDMPMETIPILQPEELEYLKMQTDLNEWKALNYGGRSTITIIKNTKNKNRNDKNARLAESQTPEVFRQSEMNYIKKIKKA